MDNFVASLIRLKIDVSDNVYLSSRSSIKIGGKASCFVTPKSNEEMIETLYVAKKNGITPKVFSGFSNSLFPDNEMKSVIISTEKMNKFVFSDDIVKCQSGVNINRLIYFAKNYNLSGLERFVGVPTKIGGAVKSNFGCYDREIKDIVKSVLSVNSNGEKVYNNAERGFSYRKSGFPKDEVIVEAELQLKYEDADKIKEEQDFYMKKRLNSQPLEYPSLGCVFKKYNGVSAGQIIDSCGLKGLQIGGAKVSPKHAGFIINVDNAKYDDVKKLIDIIREKVYNEYKIELELEINIEDEN